MTFRNSLILFSIFMAVGLSSYLAFRNGFYPAAVVNFDVITAKKLDRIYSAAYRYLQNAALSSGKSVKELEKGEARRELRRATIDKLISNLLIYQELKRRLPDDFNSIAEKNLNEFIKNNANLEQGAKLLYGMELAEFRKQILLPQAYQEILEGRMFLDNEDFNAWLNKERFRAKIIIFLPDLKWENKSVILRT